MVTDRGLFVPLASPDQLRNAQPGFAAAVSVTVEFEAYKVWSRLRLIAPLPLVIKDKPTPGAQKTCRAMASVITRLITLLAPK
jgi:hypothetical protein